MNFIKGFFQDKDGKESMGRFGIFMLILGAFGYTIATIIITIKHPESLNINTLAHNLELWSLALGFKALHKNSEK